jgi:predicted nucleotidyltransferase
MESAIQSQLNIIVKEISSMVPEAKIYLFGSYASGRQRKDSDLDICVVAKEYSARRIEVMHAIRNAVADKITLPLDILLFKQDEFRKNSLLRPTIEYSIAKEGMLLNAPPVVPSPPDES